jgi:hypothetical protein
MQISPGYAYEKAPDQEHWLGVQQTRELFAKAFGDGRRKRWRLNHSPLFLDFLEGKRDFTCTAWGIPSYSLLGWQRPCYLLDDGHVQTFKELIEDTDWDAYGRGKDPRCANCMAHCGYEPTAVIATMGSLKESIRAAVSSYPHRGRPRRRSAAAALSRGSGRADRAGAAQTVRAPRRPCTVCAPYRRSAPRERSARVRASERSAPSGTQTVCTPSRPCKALLPRGTICPEPSPTARRRWAVPSRTNPPAWADGRRAGFVLAGDRVALMARRLLEAGRCARPSRQAAPGALRTAVAATPR